MGYWETWFWVLLGHGVFFLGLHIAARLRDPSHRLFDW